MNSISRNTSNQEQAIRSFLRDYSNKPNDGQTIHGILSDACSYYDADRSYIFELNAERTHISNTYEWCRDGVSSEIGKLQNISLEGIAFWLKELEEKGEFCISSLSENFAPDSRVYQFLKPLGIESIAAVSLVVNGSVVGFLGVDNPRCNTESFLLLSVFASACCSEIVNNRLEKTNAELTALLETEKQHSAIIDSLSNVFFALYYIDIEENSFREIFSPDGRNHTYGEKDNARSRLRAVTDCWVSDDFKSAMSVFTNIDTINERLGESRIITQEYIATDGNWVRCSLFPVEKNMFGKNTKVLFGFRVITGEKERLESQDNLIRALSISYENVYAVNMDTSEGVCYRMDETMKSRYGSRFAIGDYDTSIRLYIENDVLPDDRHLFDRICTIENLRKLFAEKQTHSFSYRVCRNGSVQYFECQLVKPDSKRNEFALGFKNIDNERQHELEQQKKIENALSAVEKINETLRDETEIAGALSRDYPDVVLLDFANDTAVTIKRKGYIIEEEKRVIRRSYNDTWNYYISKYVVDEDRAALKAAILKETVIQALEKSDEYSCSYRIIADDTGIHYFQASFIRFYSRNKTESQIILGFRCVDAIVEEEHRKIKIMEAQSEIIEGLGSEYYSVLLVNPETEKVTVFRAESEDGKAIAELFDRCDSCWSKGLSIYCEDYVSEICRSEFMEKLCIEHIREDGEDYSLTYEKLTADGIIYLQARVAFVEEKNGGFVAVVGTRNVDDIIKKERQQEMALQAAYDAAEAANKAKTEFLSNMSHDIRTPMNGIIGMTAIAATHLDDKERVKDSLQKISQASKHMLSLINEVLDMSKIESGKVDLIEEEFNLSNLIDNLLTMTSEQIKKHRHELSVNITGVTHEEVIGDSLRIQKVFTNLMSNAVKYTPDGGKICLSITEKPSNYAKVGCYEFIFEDNGIGMSEDFLEQIFEPFARATDSRVNKIQGTGLGMPISRNIVRMMGGDIKVESKLNMGSRFTVTIYLKLQDTVEVRHNKFIDLHVLVADDDELSLESCCGMLEDLGMKPDGVTNGAEAVEYVTVRHRKNQDYFACIIDWKMPEMDGIATTRAIRKAVGKDVPIIIISAYDWSEIEQEARAAGANAFISKPLFRSRLEKTFSTLVGEDEQTEQGAPLLDLSNMELSDKRVLLVEDNDLNAEIAEEILGMTGLAVERAADGTIAVDMMSACEDGYYDLILMDIQMPQMNGYDATRAIRALNRSYCKQIPIIAMTANAFAEDVQAAKTVGMNEHIAKPLDLKALARTLNKWLG
ncbi:MAG: response regulator [Oscillospiraceae bacterium]